MALDRKVYRLSYRKGRRIGLARQVSASVTDASFYA
jgi:hypothetical protein